MADGDVGKKIVADVLSGAANVSSPLYSDDAIALEFSARHVGQLRRFGQFATGLVEDAAVVAGAVSVVERAGGGR